MFCCAEMRCWCNDACAMRKMMCRCAAMEGESSQGELFANLQGSSPSPSSLRDATSPERGRFHSTYRQMAKSSSFGEAGCECSEQTEEVRLFHLFCGFFVFSA